MMRMMRKMFKRIVSIVMALIVILGTAGYGGSAFAEETQEQADSASVTLSNDYIYLDPTGMVDLEDKNSADWTKSDPHTNKIAYMGIVGKSELIPADNGNDFNGCWRWKASDIINNAGFTKGNKIYFTYTNNWGSENQNTNASAEINGHNYYRTEEYKVDGDIAGTVFAQNGAASNPINNQTVYALKQLTSYAGKTISFVDMTGTQSVVKVQFSTDGKYDNTNNYVTNELDENKSVNIPQHGLNPFQYMRFVSEDGTTALTDSIVISRAISKGGILYYGIRQKDKVYSEWSSEKKSITDPGSVEKLYFDNLSFKTGNDVTIKIGDKDATKVEADTDVKDTLSYDLKANNITLANDTVISVTTNETTYRFYPNGNDNLITFSGSNLCVKGEYQASAPNTNTVYFDATLSKLSYDKSTNTNYTMPMSKTIRYHAWNSEQDVEDGFLTKMKERSDGTHTWSDVYRAELKGKYQHILFYSNSDDASENIPDTSKNKTANKTYDLTIPDMANPCFYADSSDDSTYEGKLRSGYWGEVYSIRDADGKPKDGVDGNTKAQQDSCIVDIPIDNDYTRRSDTLYVNTTLYDYYTDYELNGFNRDNYKDLNDDGIKSHRMYQPFRQFDQALSSYYESKEATSPLYWGNFQNYTGSNFQAISGTLDLYGFRSGDNLSKFYYENNSMWGIKCGLNTDSDGVLSNNGKNATQGLVSDTLSDNNLMIKTSGSGTTEAPYFNESFLNGDNSKNTVLGKVYKNVSFPFSKVHMKSPNDKDATIDYWYFNSADNNIENEISNKADIKNWNLRLQKDSSGKYYLKSHDNSSDNRVEGRTTDGTTRVGNYFPFNDNNNYSNQSGNASRLNYGFGQRFDLKFKLAKDGKVTDSKGNDVPIEFKFSGDDDVWVFIDGHLVLDIGGDHGVVNGTINFQNTDDKGPYAKVSSVKDSDKNDVHADIKYFKDISGYKDIMNNYNTKEHTLTMFYMERGLWESNMKITFNFPDENEFQVEKSVDTTAVNKEIFPETLFDNTSVFPFTIQNQATHFGIKKATAGQSVVTKVFNDSFESGKVQNVSGNTFDKVKSKDGQTDVVHWLAKLDNKGGSYKEQRWGSILPATNDSFDATYTAGSSKDHYKYLQFKFYYDYNTDNPSTQFMYIGLEDSAGKQVGSYLTNDVATATSSLTNKKWITVNVEIDKLIGSSTIDLSKIRYIRFNYDYSRDFYLDDFKFIPSSEVTNPTGFVTKQYEIADYGSVESGTLMYPENAVYTISSDKSSTTNILEDDGVFVLANGETATFSDQFRRGSYIALSEDVDTDVFDTSWTMYENGEPVTTVKKAGTTVDLDSSITNLTNQSGSTIKDGRKERYTTEFQDGQKMNNDGLDITNARSSGKTIGYPETAWAKKNGDVNTADENTIVFRSYSDPDNSTIATKLKVKYTNKVKTGTITIQKKQADVSDNLNGEYTFKVKFFNVAGMGLEGTTPIWKEYTVKKNASETFDPIVISCIPAGTQYTISEISPADGAVLERVDVSSGNELEEKYRPTVTYNETTKLTEVSGTVKANAADQTEFIFTNKLKPVINIDLTKKWNNVSGVTIPDSINIQLQRCVNDSNNWEAVQYATPGQTAADYITLKKDIYYPGKNEWTFSFTGLDRYANGADEKVDNTKPYKYRIVEVTVADGKVVKVIENSEYLNDLFKVTYTDAISAPSTEAGSSITKNYTITNTYSPLTNIKITKVDATDTSKKLNGVEFKLEKLLPDSTSDGDSFKLDPNFTAITATTGGTDDPVGTAQGIAEFKDLKDGIYRLTETKAKEGYSLLKDPITIKINRNQEDGTTVDGQPYDFTTDKNTIELQISNRMKFLLPKTGGYGAMLFILCGMALATLCCLIFFLINLRKEVQYSRHKRQRRNAIGK